jgi:HD-GYP domain-containing protein (c-di-GMP phosphodiesterase class II)
MASERIAVDTKRLCKGAYVAELDRPWLETPFVFQGFEISSPTEIKILRSCCDYVFVDTGKSNLSQEQLRDLEESQLAVGGSVRKSSQGEPQNGKLKRRFHDLLLRFDVARYFGIANRDATGRYRITSTVRREARNAQAAFEGLRSFHALMVEAVKQHGRVSIDAARQAVAPAIDSILRNPNAMAWVAFSRKSAPDEDNRAVATSVWCTMFGRHLAFDRQSLEDLAIGGLLLDVGYAQLPADVTATITSLSPDERIALERHVEEGVKILKASNGVTQNMLDMVRCHQERADGSGYPEGLTGEETPSFGRIAGVADCYDAMTSDRAYSTASAGYDTAREFNEMRGKQFQTEVVEQFLRAVGMFPTGSIVELNDGRIGVVLEQNADNALRPKVLIVRDSSHKPLKRPEVMQLRDIPMDSTSRAAAWIVNGHGHGAFGIEPRTFFGS